MAWHGAACLCAICTRACHPPGKSMQGMCQPLWCFGTQGSTRRPRRPPGGAGTALTTRNVLPASSSARNLPRAPAYSSVSTAHLAPQVKALGPDAPAARHVQQLQRLGCRRRALEKRPQPAAGHPRLAEPQRPQPTGHRVCVAGCRQQRHRVAAPGGSCAPAVCHRGRARQRQARGVPWAGRSRAQCSAACAPAAGPAARIAASRAAASRFTAALGLARLAGASAAPPVPPLPPVSSSGPAASRSSPASSATS